MKKNEKITKNFSARPPVVVIMGHIDHGKSKLLDYIRKTNIVEGEAGGITQRISAYEIVLKNENGDDKKITFLDTPGHEAFSKMRQRGANAADIAILVVSAEDGVKPQTLEAFKAISEAKIPFIVAINKIDKPEANIEKTKNSLIENSIYIEGYGGNIPFVEISAKTGQGIDALLNLILLVAEMENFVGEKEKNATGVIIESKLDTKRGITTTLIIKDGSIHKGMFVVIKDAITATRIMENFLGKNIDEASFSSPIQIVGFNKMPEVGSIFEAYTNKKEAEKALEKNIQECLTNKNEECLVNCIKEETKIIPVILKTDVFGSSEAIEKEIEKINDDNLAFKIIFKGVGNIGESDIRLVGGNQETIIIGFNVKTDSIALDLSESSKITISNFNIIYKLIDWLKEQKEIRKPRKECLETIGKAKVQKFFSRTKEKQIIGGKVIEGKISNNSKVKIWRNNFEIANGKIINLEQNKSKIKEIEKDSEFGAMIESNLEIAPGDILESFDITYK